MNQDMNQKQCHCGSKTFTIWQWDDRKGDIVFKCVVCNCEHRIRTPDVSVKEYVIFPELVPAEEGG